MTDKDATLAVLGDLRRTGVTLAIDDFGTGFSSLEYLTEMPVDRVKIDKGFVMDMERNPATIRSFATPSASSTTWA